MFLKDLYEKEYPLSQLKLLARNHYIPKKADKIQDCYPGSYRLQGFGPSFPRTSFIDKISDATGIFKYERSTAWATRLIRVWDW